MKKYSVNHQGQEFEPMSLNDIVERVRSRELDIFDYVYDQDKGEWVLMMELAELAERLKSQKPQRPPVAIPPVVPPSTKSAHDVTDWYVLKAENQFGPFSFPEMIQMMQQKVIFPFDFVWHSTMADWQRVAELAEFQPEAIRDLIKNQNSKKSLFASRQFKRQPYCGRVILHDNLSIWKGEGFEISRGGVGVKMKNALVVPGQKLTLHFHKHEDWPAFNAVCEVVSKKFVAGDSPIEYGFKFLSLSQDAEERFYKRVAQL